MKRDLQNIAMAIGLSVAVLMLVGKTTAYYITGSSAILSDAAESVIHIVVTVAAALSLWYARREASERHPYGLGKVAYFSAGFEGATIFCAAVYIYYLSVVALIAGPELKRLGTGILITAGLCLINLALGLFLIWVGRSRNSVILVANGKHVLTDMWTSAAVVVGVLVVALTNILWLDPLVAMFAATNIIWQGVTLIITSVRGLSDAADPARTRSIMACLEEATRVGTIRGFHQLKHRESNDRIWVEVHMLVPGTMLTLDAHGAVTRVEEQIEGLFPGSIVHITTHIEPERHDAAHPAGHLGLRDPFEHHGTPVP